MTDASTPSRCLCDPHAIPGKASARVKDLGCERPLLKFCDATNLSCLGNMPTPLMLIKSSCFRSQTKRKGRTSEMVGHAADASQRLGIMHGFELSSRNYTCTSCDVRTESVSFFIATYNLNIYTQYLKMKITIAAHCGRLEWTTVASMTPP